MTGSEYRAAIKKLGLTHKEAAFLFGVDHGTSRNWASRGVTEPVAMVLRIALRLEWTADYLRQVSKPDPNQATRSAPYPTVDRADR